MSENASEENRVRSSVDRRVFLRRAGTGVVAGGALWVAPSIISGSTAFAAGSGGTTSEPTVTLPPALQLPFDSNVPDTYSVAIPAGRAVSYSVIGGGGAAAAGSTVGGTATKITGTIPARTPGYLLSVVVAQGGQAATEGDDGVSTVRGAGGTGNPQGGNGGNSTVIDNNPDTNNAIYGAGGGGGASTVANSDLSIRIIAPGGAGIGAGIGTPSTPPTVASPVPETGIVGNSGGGNSGGGGGGPLSGTAPGGAGTGGADAGSEGTPSGGGNGGTGPFGGGGGGGGLVGGGGGGGMLASPNRGSGGGGGSAIATGGGTASAIATDETSGTGGTAVANFVNMAGQNGRVVLTLV